VQPFVRKVLESQTGVHLLMQPMNSKADPDIKPASQYSTYGIDWKPLPSGICVTGSRYAFVMGEINAEEFELPVHQYAVEYGRSRGKMPGITSRVVLIRHASSESTPLMPGCNNQ
jgi:hypothetical protein